MSLLKTNVKRLNSNPQTLTAFQFMVLSTFLAKDLQTLEDCFKKGAKIQRD